MIRISGAGFKEKLLLKRVEKACFEQLKQKNFFVIDVAIVSEDEIHTLNLSQRGVDRVTDVLSFPTFEPLALPVDKDSFSDADYDGKRVVLGSIVICRKRAKEQAVEYGHTYERELGFLLCHGILHLMGFDHIQPEDEKVMIAHQHRIMSKVGLKR